MKSADIDRWKVVLLHFGNKRKDTIKTRHDFDEKYEFLLGNEFDYTHMAVIINNDENSHTCIVVPMTSYNPHKNEYIGDVLIKKGQYGMSFLQNDTLIRTECIRQISHRRIKRVISHHVSTTVRDKIKKAIENTMLNLTR